MTTPFRLLAHGIPSALVSLCLLSACSGTEGGSPPPTGLEPGPTPAVDGSAEGAVGDGSVVPLAADAGPELEDGGTPDGDAAPPQPEPSYGEVFEQGLTKYVGTPQVQTTEVTTSGSGARAIDIHHFSGDERGPLCMYGGEFFVESRQGESDELLIFLQGGGVCLTEICAATPDPILSLQLFEVASLIGIGGMLDPGKAENPFKDFDVVNAPYCDGSLFAGDVDRVLSDGNPDNGEDDQAYQRGLQNLTATLETAKRLFPNPKRIVLVGSSGWAYGVVAGTVLTRHFYPDHPLLVISDSGAPVVSSADTGFITRALEEFNAIDLIPKSCPDCIANGHATGMLGWALGFDPNLSVAYMTYARDHVIGEFFMRTTAQQFEDAVVGESARLMEKFPNRAFRFVLPGSKHTLAMGLDGIPDDLQGGALGTVGSFGAGFVGPDVNSEALAKWTLGGLGEAGMDEGGTEWTGYQWLERLLDDPATTPDVLNLQ